ncbi:MAG TPA: hypothetical protein VGU69_10580 [Rhizomicrobium sp.]|nr:hypothetical protein [Rhizomicrobium sp.]
MDQHDPNVTVAAFARFPKRARRRQQVTDLSLAQQLHAGYRTVEVAWGNPHTSPPEGADRIKWSFCLPNHANYGAVMAEHAPAVIPGSGWCIRVGGYTPPRTQWSEETKGRVRRGNLRKRLDKAVPLFADIFFAEEVERRAAYFAGKPYEFTLPSRERAADAGTDDAGIGHNSGARPRAVPLLPPKEY